MGGTAVLTIDGVTAAVGIGIGLSLTLLIGIASQHLGRPSARPHRTRTVPVSPPPGPTSEQQDDVDAVNRGIELARKELLWLRDQVARERSRLESLRRQQTPPGPIADSALHAATPDSPWTVLGLPPGAGSEEVRYRFRLLSRVWHPDRFTDGPDELRAEAEVMMARLNRAHQALTSGQRGSSRR